MATAYIRFGGAMGGGAPVYSPKPRSSQAITTSASSQASTITAETGEYARIVCSGGAINIAVGPSPTAVAGDGDVVLDGMALDIGPLKAGDKVAVINAA